MPDIFEQVLEEVKSTVGDFTKTANERISKMQAQLDSLDMKLARPAGGASGAQDSAAAIAKKFLESKGDFDRHKRISFEVPSPTLQIKTITSSGLTVNSPADQIGNMGEYGYGAVRALFRAAPVDGAGVFQVRESASTGWAASPQSESNAKAESTTTLTGEAAPIRTIAHWLSVSRQALDDVKGLEEFLRSRLLWGLAAKIDQELLAGDNTGEHLNGLITQASSFDTSVLSPSAGWDFSEVLGAAAVQCRIAGYNPTFAVLNPRDAFKLRFTRDTTGQYIAAPPSIPVIVESIAMTEGSFLVGDASQALVRVKMEATIDVSESHASYFTSNLIAIRAEERMTLQVISPKGFITGTINSSPA